MLQAKHIRSSPYFLAYCDLDVGRSVIHSRIAQSLRTPSILCHSLHALCVPVKDTWHRHVHKIRRKGYIRMADHANYAEIPHILLRIVA
jgi:hypothetical protein